MSPGEKQYNFLKIAASRRQKTKNTAKNLLRKCFKLKNGRFAAQNAKEKALKKRAASRLQKAKNAFLIFLSSLKNTGSNINFRGEFLISIKNSPRFSYHFLASRYSLVL